MDPTNALEWQAPAEWRKITVIDSHTGGEPFRLVVDGLPAIEGTTILERRQYARENLDWLRRALMWEPRGHADMYGGWIVPPETPDGDIGILFTHNSGFSTMCGHGIIALAKLVIETGMLPASGPETTLRIDTPAGQVLATATLEGQTVTRTRFENVPSFAVDMDATVGTPEFGPIRYDLAFGGAFYAMVDIDPVGLTFDDTAALIAAGRALKRAISVSREITHPAADDLGFLYGVIFTGAAREAGSHSRNVCVFADGEVDRSPTGTGVSARLAILSARGELDVGEEITVESIVGSRFTGTIARKTQIGGHDAVIPEISGTAHLLGRAELWLSPEDVLGRGFLVR
jgi:trans-L-3-hydroxyproline dehydratase